MLLYTAGSATDGKGGPHEVLRTAHNDWVPARGPPKDKVWSLQKWAWCLPGEAGGQRGHHRSRQERGVGGAMARDADKTAPQNAPAEQRVAREQRVTADKREPRLSLKAPRRRSGGEMAGIGSGRLPGRIKTRLTGDGGRVAAQVCGDRGRVHGVDEEQRCRQHSHGGAQQEDAARHSEVRVREPANLEGHEFGETKAAREELLHIRGLEEEVGPSRPLEAFCEGARGLTRSQGRCLL
jgi:hypothetical protein